MTDAARSPVVSKQQNHRLWTTGGLGNRLKVWTLEEHLDSSFLGRVSLRYLGTGGGGPCIYDLRQEEVQPAVERLVVEGWRRDLFMVNEGAPDDDIAVQGEFLNEEPGAFLFSTVKKKMRDALREAPRTVTGFAGRFILQELMTPSSWSDFEALLELYPGHALEVSVYRRNLGDIPGRNALVWEVRRY